MEEVMEEGDKKVEVSEDTNTHEEATKLIEDQKEVTENIQVFFIWKSGSDKSSK